MPCMITGEAFLVYQPVVTTERSMASHNYVKETELALFYKSAVHIINPWHIASRPSISADHLSTCIYLYGYDATDRVRVARDL
jgi:hypothetical protein